MRPPLKISFWGIKITIGWDKLTPWLITLVNGLQWGQYRHQVVDKYGEVGGDFVDEAHAWVISQIGE